MANIISLHVIRSYGVNNMNRDGNQIVKSVTVGGDLRVRQSSQAWKHVIREAIARRFGKTHHTRYILTLLMDRAKDRGLVAEGEEDAWTQAFELLAFSNDKDANDEESAPAKSGKKKARPAQAAKAGKTEKAGKDGSRISDQVAAYSDKEIDAIVDFVQTKGVHAIDASAVQDLCAMLKLVSVGVEIAVFGRMTTAGIGSTVPSATHFNHAYSIDENLGEYDYFTAVDNVMPNSGAAHLDSFSIASATMYGYFNIDPQQVYENLASELRYNPALGDEERTEREKALKALAKQAVIETIRSYLSYHPAGKQNSMASYPVPSAVYASVVRDGFPCTMDNAFNAVLRKYRRGEKPIAAKGALKMASYIAEDQPAQNYTYQAFCMDSTTREWAAEEIAAKIGDRMPIYRMNQLETMLGGIDKEIDDILGL